MTEVLIAMFVMTVGMLGLAALVPVGGSDVATANRYDRTSALGRAAFRDAQVRDWLDPGMWLDYSGAAPTDWPDLDFPISGTPRSLGTSPLNYANSFCIDPLFVAANNPPMVAALDDRIATFPYLLDEPSEVLIASDSDDDGDVDANDLDVAPNPPRMLRGTLRAWPNATTPISYALADRLFVSSDDLTFGLPEGVADGRPFASLGANNQVRQSAGDYSWLITVSPLLNEYTTAATPAPASLTYKVSIVIFYKRTLNLAPDMLANRVGAAPTERLVFADFPGGIGSLDVRLGLPIDNSAINNNPDLPKQSDFPVVRAGQWIMLCGWTHYGGGTPTPRAPVFRWYRVVSAGELKYEDTNEVQVHTDRSNLDEWAQYVTLAGPDWVPPGTPSTGYAAMYLDADTPPGSAPVHPMTLHAAIFDGVVGVYEKTIQLDTSTFGVR